MKGKVYRVREARGPNYVLLDGITEELHVSRFEPFPTVVKDAIPCAPNLGDVLKDRLYPGPPHPNSTAPTNPKQRYGDKKPPLHLIHMIAQLHESAALHAGKRKYGENNYLQTPVELMTYIGAIMRHCLQYASGERVDPKELVHHLGAIKACCTILLSAEATGMLVDNRVVIPGQPAVPTRQPRSYQAATQATFSEVEKVIEHLNELYPNLL